MTRGNVEIPEGWKKSYDGGKFKRVFLNGDAHLCFFCENAEGCRQEVDENTNKFVGIVLPRNYSEEGCLCLTASPFKRFILKIINTPSRINSPIETRK